MKRISLAGSSNVTGLFPHLFSSLFLGATLALGLLAIGCGSDSGMTGDAGSAGGAIGSGGAAGSTGAGGSGGSGGAAGADVDGGGVDVMLVPADAPDSSVAPEVPAPEETAPPPPMSALDLCAAFCNRVTTCATSRDEQTCTNACTNANAALFPKLRADLIAAAASCVRGKDCSTITQEAALRSCLAEAAAATGPSPAATAFCDALDTGETRCGVTIDKADCLTRSKVYADPTLTDATACTTKSCSLVFACAAATLTESSGSWSLGGGLKPGKRCTGTATSCSSFSPYYYNSNPAQCQAAGCTFNGMCTGTPHPCSYENGYQPSCEQMAGCTYSGNLCSGTRPACATLTTSTDCQTGSGCSWLGLCTGTVPACNTLGIASCAGQPGCMLQDAP